MTVTIAKIAVALGVDTPSAGSPEALQWAMWVEDAELLIETRRLALELPAVDEIKRDYVVRQAVVAHIRHPDDATQVTVSVDDASTSRTYRSSRGQITILDEWWNLLGLVDKSEGAFAIDTIGTRYSAHADICALVFGALYCSCGATLTNLYYPLYERTEG